LRPFKIAWSSARKKLEILINSENSSNQSPLMLLLSIMNLWWLQIFMCCEKVSGAKIIILSLIISRAHVVMPTCYEPWKIWNNRYALKVLKFLVLLFARIRQWRLLIVSIIQIQFCMNSKANPWLLGCYLYFIRWKRRQRVIQMKETGDSRGL
jgi:hypothetical protein